MIIMVTGSEGFVGRNVCNMFKRMHPSLTVIPIHKDEHYSSKPPQYGCDLMSADSTYRVMRRFMPDIVIHLAGTVGGIGANAERPAQFMHDNLVMGTNVLETASIQGVDRVVMVGTVCSYPQIPKTIPFVEEELWDGYPEETNAPYGIAKRTLIEMALQYNKQYMMDNICLIPVNMYGPHDNFDPYTSHVIPALMQKIHIAKEKGYKQVEIWGTGQATREFLYVEDFACACMNAAITNKSFDYPINVGTGEEVAILTIMEYLREMIGYEGEFVYAYDKPDGQPRRTLNIKRAQRDLRWCPTTDLRQGLQKTYHWYLENIYDKDAHI